jgi:anti-sigma B factor antagonist
MDVVETRSGDVTLLDVSGRITYMQGDTVLRAAIQGLVDRGLHKIVLNLAGITYLDSAGLGELVSAHTVVTRAGGNLRLCGVSGYLKELLTVTRLVTVFEIFESPDEAVGSFAAGAGA